MGTIQQKPLWLDVKLSESLIFKPPTRLGIYWLHSKERRFQGRIPPNERPEIMSDLIQYIKQEFQIASQISLLGPNGIFFKNSEIVTTLPQHCKLLVCPAIVTKHISTQTSSQPVSLSTASTEINASTKTIVAVASVVSSNPGINAATIKGASLSDSDSVVDDTNCNDTTQKDDEEILETTTMRKPVFTATSMSVADCKFSDVQRRLNNFMNEASIEERQELKKWFLESYEPFELNCLVSANVTAESRHVPCSAVDTNEIEMSMGSETVLNDLTSQLTRTRAEATPPAFQLIANEPTDNQVSELLIDDTDLRFDVEDSTFIAEEIEVNGSNRKETSLNEDNNTRTFVIYISDTTVDTPESSVQGSNSEIVESPRVKSKNACSQNVPLEITERAGIQLQRLASKPKIVTAKAEPRHSCSYPSCSFKAHDRGALKLHLDKVHFEKLFKCSKCDCKYRHPGSLSLHLKTHEEKKQICPFENCNYKSYRSSSLKTHMMMHTGEKPFACKQCDFRSCHQQNLKVHVKNRHGVKK